MLNASRKPNLAAQNISPCHLWQSRQSFVCFSHHSWSFGFSSDKAASLCTVSRKLSFGTMWVFFIHLLLRIPCPYFVVVSETTIQHSMLALMNPLLSSIPPLLCLLASECKSFFSRFSFNALMYYFLFSRRPSEKSLYMKQDSPESTHKFQQCDFSFSFCFWPLIQFQENKALVRPRVTSP